MLAASGYKIFEAFHKHAGAAAQENWRMVILASVVAAVVSFIAVKWLLRYVQTHTFIAFGWYRVALGAALLNRRRHACHSQTRRIVVQIRAKPPLDLRHGHPFAC